MRKTGNKRVIFNKRKNIAGDWAGAGEVEFAFDLFYQIAGRWFGFLMSISLLFCVGFFRVG
jgi:hypothetical protein